MDSMAPKEDPPLSNDLQSTTTTYSEEQPKDQPTGGVGHSMHASDPDNPQNWPLYRKVYASSVAFAFAFAVAFGLTSYTTAIGDIMIEFNVSMTAAIVPFSIYFVGIAFAPVWTPHVTEKFGRMPVYLVSLPVCALFLLGVSRVQTFGGLVVLRFLAGFAGGPCLVLIEGTFADCWHSKTTLTYYSVLNLASYLGAAFGQVVLGNIVPSTSWRWPAYVSMMVCLAAFLLGIGVPETYGRVIVRNRARRTGKPHSLPPAASGTTLAAMAKVTVVNPITMLFTEPLVAMFTLYVSFIFGTTFQWFIAVPAALHGAYGFGVQSSGLAFISAVVGALLASGTTTLIERITIMGKLRTQRSRESVKMHIEERMIPAMVGSFIMTGAFFWVGWTASPAFKWAVPVVGTGAYVYGSAMVLISHISYMFDAYPPAGTLSALTIGASMRLLLAAAIPLVIIQDITGIGGDWAYGTFGILSGVLISINFIIWRFGSRLRMKSRFNTEHLTIITLRMQQEKV